MTAPRLRPTYVSFDWYGTLIHFEITSVTRRLLGDRLDEAQTQAFLARFSKYRYDQVCGSYYAHQQVLHDAYARTCAKWGLEVNEDAGEQLAAAVRTWGPHDDVPAPLKLMADNYPLGFTQKVFLDRDYDPESPPYNYISVSSLDELNTMLGL